MPASKHFTNLFAKFAIIVLINLIILANLSRLNNVQAILTALAITVIVYIGDLFILPVFGIVFTTITDLLISAVVISVADRIVNGFITIAAWGWILTLAALFLEEWYYHRYLESTSTTVKEDLK